MQRQSLRALAAAMTIATLAGACGGGSGDGDGEEAGGTTTTAEAVSSTATTAPLAGPTRIEQVLAELLALRNQVFSSPDPSRVNEYALAECRCAEEDRKSLEGLAQRFEHWDSPQLELRGARVAERPNADMVVLEAVVGRPPERVVNRSGAIVGGQGQGLPNFPARFVLRRRISGKWGLFEVGNIELPQAEIDAIAAAGVPSGPPDANSRL